jgi:hypothetical protein
LPGGELVALNVGADGVLYLVVAHKLLDYRTTAPGARSPRRSRMHHRRTGSWGCSTAGCVSQTLVEREAFNIYDVQPLGDDPLLVCGRRPWAP